MTNHQLKLDEMLREAVRDGGYKLVTKLARAGANVNQVTGHGWTPIASAVYDKDRRVCEAIPIRSKNGH